MNPVLPANMKKILVTDFDGTLTKWDFYDLVRKKWALTQSDDPWDAYLSGRISHFEALAEIFSRIRATEVELAEIATAMELVPQLADGISALKKNGWEVRVASAGCEWYINRLLHLANVSITVHANPGVFDPDAGLVMYPPLESPFFSPTTGIDKLAIVSDALATADHVAFAGDGRPDLDPILLVDPRFRFARGWLADELSRREEQFHQFDVWSEIPEVLLKC